MKKFSKLFCVLMMTLMLVMPFAGVDAKTTTKKKTTTTTTTSTATKSTDENAINVYVFYSSTCPHCKDLHAYLDELKNDKDVRDKFNIVDYEVSTAENIDLMNKVSDYFKANITGVPFYVIGDKYFEGYSDNSKSSILDAIKDNYGSSKYKDVVASVLDGTAGELDDQGSNVVGMVILGITVVIIIVLIVCSSKNKYYDDEEESDTEDKEEALDEKTEEAESEEESDDDVEEESDNHDEIKEIKFEEKTSNKNTSTKKNTKNTKTSKKK